MDLTFQKIVIGIVGFLIALNLVILDIEVLRESPNPTIQTIVQKTLPMPTQVPQPTTIQSLIKTSQTCSPSCIDLIQEATASLKLDKTTTTQTNTSPSTAKEFFISMGSGSTSAGDWEDVNGLQAYVDTTQYNGIKSAIFEASVRVPTINQWVDVRLYNVTDKHPVWFSEVRFPGGSDPKLIRSETMVLDPGSKLLQVQMRTQLRHIAYLDQSRIVITTY